MKIPTKSVLAGMALASMLLAGAGPAAAAGASTTSTECGIDDWNDAPASAYCSNATVTASHAMDGCDVSATCSVTFTDGPGGLNSVTVTPTLSLTVEHEELDDIVICISRSQSAKVGVSPLVTDSSHEYTAAARTSCREGEATAAEAVDGEFHTD